MPRQQMANMHLPLPETVHTRLRSEARRVGRPATDLAREAIDYWLDEIQRQAVHNAVLAYAREAAGSRDDLDPDLEKAGLEHLRSDQGRGGRRRP